VEVKRGSYLNQPFEEEFKYIHKKELNLNNDVVEFINERNSVLPNNIEENLYDNNNVEEFISIQDQLESVNSNPIENEEIIQDNYADLCRAHFEKYVTDSEQYILETDLSKRVTQWNDKLKPILYDQKKKESHSILETTQKRY